MYTTEIRLFGLFLDVLGAILLALNGTPFLNRKLDQFTDSRPFTKVKRKLFETGEITNDDKGFRALMDAHGEIFPAEGRDSPYPPYPMRVELNPLDMDNAHFVTESGTMDLEGQEVGELLYYFEDPDQAWFSSRQELDFEDNKVSLGEPSTGPLLYGFDELWADRRDRYEDYLVYFSALLIIVGFIIVSLTFL